MRSFAHTILIACCLMVVRPQICLAEDNRPLKRLGQVKIEKKKKNLGTVPFRPEFSIDHNNRNIASYHAKSTSISAVLPLQVLAVENFDEKSLVNRSMLLEVDGHFYSGRITGVMLNGSQTATVFAQIDNDQHNSINQLDQKTGVLSIGE